MITAKDLKNILKDVRDDAIVMVSSDSEGNTVSPMFQFDTGVIGTEYSWTVDGMKVVVHSGEDFCDIDYEKNKGKQFVIIYPTL